MPRKKLLRSLPSLPKSLIVGPREHKTERILEILRNLASAAQEDQPHTFYSMRQVVEAFKVPISTVSRIYGRLEHEGILNRIRGSKTTLNGLKYDRKLSVRAFIGLPGSTSRFLTIQNYRMFFMRIRRQLRSSGFAAVTLFLDSPDPAELVDRVKKYEIDTLIWLEPGRLAEEASLQLNDLGIRLIGVSDAQTPSLPCRYKVRREGAIKAILKDWQSVGLKSAVVVSDKSRSSAVDEQRLQEILGASGFEHEFVNLGASAIPAFLETLAQKQNTGIIFSSSSASLFSFRAPEIMTQFFERCRVALVAGPADMPFAKVPAVRVDLVMVDWQLVAERIVNDLITQDAFGSAETVVFEAEGKLQVPLNQYAQST